MSIQNRLGNCLYYQMRVIKYDSPEASKTVLTDGLLSKMHSNTAAGMKTKLSA